MNGPRRESCRREMLWPGATHGRGLRRHAPPAARRGRGSGHLAATIVIRAQGKKQRRIHDDLGGQREGRIREIENGHRDGVSASSAQNGSVGGGSDFRNSPSPSTGPPCRTAALVSGLRPNPSRLSSAMVSSQRSPGCNAVAPLSMFRRLSRNHSQSRGNCSARWERKTSTAFCPCSQA